MAPKLCKTFVLAHTFILLLIEKFYLCRIIDKSGSPRYTIAGIYRSIRAGDLPGNRNLGFSTECEFLRRRYTVAAFPFPCVVNRREDLACVFSIATLLFLIRASVKYLPGDSFPFHSYLETNLRGIVPINRKTCRWKSLCFAATAGRVGTTCPDRVIYVAP